MYHAACKVEFQPFNRSYSQLTFSNFILRVIYIYRFFEEDHGFPPMTPGFNQRKPGLFEEDHVFPPMTPGFNQRKPGL